jgi:uncharacterized protein with GYD domain
MATYLMFGTYSPEGLAQVSADRTLEAKALIEKLGGKLKDVYALLGEKELVLIVQFPGTAEVMKASMALTKLSGVRFSTVPALAVEEFDKLFTG